MNPKQLGLIHGLKRKAGLDDPGYRLILRNIGGVASSKDLTQTGFDEVMASIEEAGEVSGIRIGTYWRDRLGRGASGTARMVHKIHALYASYEQLRDPVESTHYELAGLVKNSSRQRTSDPAQLTAREAWTLIEALKSIVAREEHRQRETGNRLFGDKRREIRGEGEDDGSLPSPLTPDCSVATLAPDDIPF